MLYLNGMKLFKRYVVGLRVQLSNREAAYSMHEGSSVPSPQHWDLYIHACTLCIVLSPCDKLFFFLLRYTDNA